MNKQEFLNSKEVAETYAEIKEFYIEKNKEENMGIEENKIEKLAYERACAEVYVQFCKNGTMEKPDKCQNCPCCVRNEKLENINKYIEKPYLVCSMAPSYIAHQPNITEVGKPSYCPIDGNDELYEIIKMITEKRSVVQ